MTFLQTDKRIVAMTALFFAGVTTSAYAQDTSSMDARDKVVENCMAEAKARGEKMGAVDVSIRQVEDTDEKSDGRASVRAEVDVVTKDKNGELKKKKRTIKCDTRNGVVTAFSYD